MVMVNTADGRQSNDLNMPLSTGVSMMMPPQSHSNRKSDRGRYTNHTNSQMHKTVSSPVQFNIINKPNLHTKRDIK